MKTEVNLSDHYKKDLINLLTTFSKYTKKSFKSITKDDIIYFLESFRRPEASDPLHKWIGTYNLYRIHLMRFFKWFYYPDIEPNKRPKPETLIDSIPYVKDYLDNEHPQQGNPNAIFISGTGKSLGRRLVQNH